MRNPPLEVVATWPKPNYDNPEHRGPALLIVEVTIMSVAILTLMARLYVRIFKVNKHGLDDWLMLAAMVSHLKPRQHVRRSISISNADLRNPRSLESVSLFVSFSQLSCTVGTSTFGISENHKQKQAERFLLLLKHCFCSRQVWPKTPSLSLTCALPLLVPGFDV